MPLRPKGVEGRELVLAVGRTLGLEAVRGRDEERERDLGASGAMKGAAPGTVPSVRPARALGA